jgi:hypothetical protein
LLAHNSRSIVIRYGMLDWSWLGEGEAPWLRPHRGHHHNLRLASVRARQGALTGRQGHFTPVPGALQARRRMQEGGVALFMRTSGLPRLANPLAPAGWGHWPGWALLLCYLLGHIPEHYRPS